MTPSSEELVGMFFKWDDPSNSDRGFAVLPYIKGLTEPLTRLLRNNGIRTTSRPLMTLQQEFVSPKSRSPVDQQTNAVYKIPCADCPWSYIGETGRCLKTRVKEHTRNTKAFKKGSNIATHAWLNDHSIESIREISALEKHWNPGTQQLQATQTIMRNNYLDNIQFYYDLLISILFPLKYFYCFLL